MRLAPAASSRLLLGAALCLAGAEAAVRAAVPDVPPAVLESHSAVLSDPSYQTELPLGGIGRPSRSGTGGTSGRDPRLPEEAYPGEEERREPWRDDGETPAEAGGGHETRLPVPTWLEYALWAGGAVVLALLVLSWLRDRKHPYGPGQVDLDVMPPEHRARPDLADDDEVASLVAQGAYGEAAHLLLRRVIDHLTRRQIERLPPALTSRELTRRASLSPSIRPDFENLVLAVERFWFGGEELDRAGYERCATAYRVITGNAAPAVPGAVP